MYGYVIYIYLKSSSFYIKSSTAFMPSFVVYEFTSKAVQRLCHVFHMNLRQKQYSFDAICSILIYDKSSTAFIYIMSYAIFHAQAAQ